MSMVSHLNVRVDPGQRDAAARDFVELQVLERCAEVIPGFLRGEMLLSASDGGLRGWSETVVRSVS